MRAAKGAQVGALADKLTPEKGMIVAEVDLEAGQLRDLAEQLAKKHESCAIILGSKSGDKCALVARVSADLVGKGLKAGDLIKQLAPMVGGGGGGKADFAQAGGKEPSGLAEALDKGRTLIAQCLS